MADALTLIVAAGFAAMGLLALARPADVLAQFGVSVETRRDLSRFPRSANPARREYLGARPLKLPWK